MKNLVLRFLLSCFFIFSVSGLALSANELFRSNASGNWNATSTWQMSTDGGFVWFAATKTPNDSASTITVRSPNTVTVTADVNADQLVVDGGATISINSTMNLNILDGGGDDMTLNNTGIISGSGTIQTQGANVTLIIKNGSSFNASLKIYSGTALAYDNGAPWTAKFNGPVSVDAGTVFGPWSFGYFVEANNSVTNNGTITGNGSTFILKGPSLVNNGIINVAYLNFESAITVSGAGTYNGQFMNINSPGNVTISNNVTFSPGNSFNINNGGSFTPGTKVFTFNSGSFVINNGGSVTGTGPNAGTLQTQGNVSFLFRNGSTFNSAVKVNTGTLTAYNDNSPYVAVFYGSITVDAGAVMTVAGGGYFTQANNSVTNNGTISGSSSTFIMRGSTLVNNGVINPAYFNFDSTTAISGTGTYSGTFININATGNVSLASNLSFSPTSGFTVNTGGKFNPNTRTFTLNAGSLTTHSGSNLVNSGIFQTQGSLNLYVKGGSNFNTPFKVNTGTSVIYDPGFPYISPFNGTITVDAGATLSVGGGGYFVRANGNVTNNGTINANGSTFIMRGASLTNNSLINPYYLNFDSTTALSGSGTYSATIITINGSGNVSLSNNVTFSPVSSFTINSGGILNPNTRVFTLNTGSLTAASGSTVSNSGTFQTQGTVGLFVKDGANFNAPLKINSGAATAYDPGFPYTSSFNGTITVDAGAVFSVGGGGYFVRANNNITNNGTMTGNGSTFRFFGSNFTNNGTLSSTAFNFEGGSQTLQGTGTWSINPGILSGSTVTLASNHQMQGININSGGTFALSAFRLMLTASNPITNNGTFTTTGGAVEYDGTSAQSISTTNITYYKLRINNSAGTSLSGPVTVIDTLSVIQGDLNLNGQVLSISPSGYLTETTGNTINGSSGYVTTTRNLNAPSAINVGGLGAVLTTAVNLGSTEVRRGHAAQNGLNGSTSILRYYDITPTTNTGLGATMVFNFDESELNGKVEAALSLFKSTNTGSSWTVQGGTVNTAANNITLTGISSFSRWSAGAPTAVASTLKLVLEGFYNTTTGRLNMRDTVRAYLRNTASPFAVVDSAKSVIDSVTFNGTFLFANAPTGTYYIQTKHRNALETWSKSGGESYTLGSAFSYDFTTDSAKAYQNNMKKTGTKWAFYEGDVNQEGNVDLSDVIIIYNNASSFINGYVNTDVNGDRLTDLSDVILAYNNSVAFVSKKAP